MNTSPKLFAIQPYTWLTRKLELFAADLLTVVSMVFAQLTFFRLLDFVWFRSAVVTVATVTDKR